MRYTLGASRTHAVLATRRWIVLRVHQHDVVQALIRREDPDESTLVRKGTRARPRRVSVVRYIAFLRGINLGGHNVKMDRLRVLFEELGLGDVSTFIASGNVIFDSDERDPDALEDRIEAHLAQALGYDVPTFVRTDLELARVAAFEPFPSIDRRDGDTVHIAFLGHAPDTAAAAAVAELANDDDLFRVDGRELYWLRRGRLSDSPISGAMLEKAMGQPSTLRNANTVRKIAAKFPP
jgi:uncharacterized protein (DUF1697 family)